MTGIVLVYAMQAEAEPFLRECECTEVAFPGPAWLPFRRFRCRFDEHWLDVLVSGSDTRFDVDNIGLEAATLLAYLAVHELKPGLLISCGTAGGFASHGAGIGTVYLGDTFLFHDRHVPLPGFAESALSKTRTFDASVLAEKLGLARVTVSSGSSLRRSDSDVAVMQAHDVRAKEMEVAAAAWVCQMSGTPLLAIKSINNLLDAEESSEDQFRRHFDVAVAALAEQTVRVLRALPKG